MWGFESGEARWRGEAAGREAAWAQRGVARLHPCQRAALVAQEGDREGTVGHVSLLDVVFDGGSCRGCGGKGAGAGGVRSLMVAR